MRTGGEPPLVAREDELRLVRGVAGFSPGPGAVVIEGEAGIGKTALWRAALEAAGEAGAQVRAAAAAESEARFAFAPLADLLRRIPRAVLQALPRVQRTALERALLLTESRDGDVELHAISSGFAAALSLLAAAAPLLLAVDDVQWLDAGSAAVLTYALRRAAGERIRFVLTRRTGVDDAVLRDGLAVAQTIRLQPLTVGALQRLLLSHGHALTGLVVRRLHEQSGGNPYFALEMARAIERRGGRLERLGVVPVPDTLVGLLGERVEGLDADGERAVLAVALAADPVRSRLADVLGGSSGLDAAEEAGLLVLEGDRMRLAHPLVGTAARARASAPALRRLHVSLAHTAATDEERARHLALSVEPPDAAIAEIAERAAAAVDGRGATAAAAELSREAVRFTPPDDGPALRRRLLAAGDLHMRAGLLRDGRALLEPALGLFPPGEERATAKYHLLRLQRRDLDWPAWEELAEEAAGRLRAEILTELSFGGAAGGVERLDEAHAWAAEAVELAVAEGDPVLELGARQSLAFVAAMRGDLEPARALQTLPTPPTLPLTNGPARIAAIVAIWRGDVDAAEAHLARLLEESSRRGEEWALATALLHTFELDARIGDRHRVERTMERFEAAAAPLGAPMADESLPRMQAYAAALVGDRERAAACRLTAAANWQALETQRAIGLAALLSGDAASAVAELGAVHDRVRCVRDPGVFPVAPDYAEALAAAGRVAEAREVADALLATAVELDHAWAAATGARARGLAEDDARAAEVRFRDALELHASLRLPLDEARTKLALGSLLRRERRLREARALLSDAAETFDALGVAPLAARARAEVDRIPGRRTAGGLTPAEEQVALLVAQGRTNREVAAALVVTPKVVERHLTRVYAKLGLRTRADLARLVAESGGIPRLEREAAET